jgi:hypothetical protein
MHTKIDMKYSSIHEGVEKLMQWHPKMDNLTCKHLWVWHYCTLKLFHISPFHIKKINLLHGIFDQSHVQGYS